MPKMRSHFLKWSVGLSLLSVLSGCGKPISKADLPGIYVADFGLATDTLTVRADSTFTQTIKVKTTGKTAAANGTWHFDQEDREIHFSEFMVVINGFSELVTNFADAKNRGPQFAPVRRVFGRLEIGGDDLPWGRKGVESPYKKQPTSK